MVIKKAQLVSVAVKADQYPPSDLPEIAFAGRSNVGKSSLFNMLVNRKNLAHVSGSPGKTQTINFFEINDALRIVDLPGYGYAKVSKAQNRDWGPMMDNYLESRENLVKVIQLVDIRHEPSAQDVQMYEYLKYHGLDGVVVATKADKVSRNEQNKNISNIRKTLGMRPDDVVVAVSALKKTGGDALWDILESLADEYERK
jgi:GTP-binding protein